MRDPIDNLKAPDWRESTAVEVEDALAKVWDKIDSKPDSGQPRQENVWRYYAAAAVILIMAGFGFLYTPVTYTAEPGENLTVILSDDSEVELAAGSSISHNRLFGLTNRDLKMDGHAFFRVRKNEIPFTIKGPRTVTSVLGTSFDLEDWSGRDFREASLTVVEGSVRFEATETGEKRIVKGQEAVRIDGNKRLRDRRYEERAVSWLEGNLFFDDRNLHDVFEILQRDFNLNIEHPDEHLPDARITAFYNKGMDLEAILDDICTIHGLSYYRNSTGFRIVNE